MACQPLTQNTLFCGDNLHVLRERIPAGSVDLVYLDPPFNSSREYRVRARAGRGRAVTAFADTWRWDAAAEADYRALLGRAPERVAAGLQALRGISGEGPLLAYLVMMAARLVELHRVLRPTGSLYLHCDPTASHYLKLLLDTIFGPERFVNEISWLRSQSRSAIRRVYRRAHDVLLFYTKSEAYTFHLQYRALSAGSQKHYTRQDARGPYRLVPLLVSGRRKGETGQPWGGIDPNTRGKNGMHWVTRPARLDAYAREGLVVWPARPGGVPQLKYYLADNPGVPLNDFWDDINLVGAASGEASGYPTQKPLALLERIVAASSSPGDWLLDPFCGCGTALAAAHKLGRHWIGIDSAAVSLAFQQQRLAESFALEADRDYAVIHV